MKIVKDIFKLKLVILQKFNNFLNILLATKEGAGGLLSTLTNEHESFNGELFKGSLTTQISGCTLKYYEANMINPTLHEAYCLYISHSHDRICKTDCSKLFLARLTPGSAYMLEITPIGISDPDNFKEYIFIRTSNNLLRFCIKKIKKVVHMIWIVNLLSHQ